MRASVKPFIFWGGTGQARVLRELLSDDCEIVAIVDKALTRSGFAGAIVLKDEAAASDWLAGQVAEGVWGAVAIGGQHGAERRRIARFLTDHGVFLPTLIHRDARVARDASIGAATQVLIGAIVASGAKIGTSVIVNSGAQVDHDCVIGDGAHLAPGVITAGQVEIGADAFIGTGAIIHPRVSIGEGSRIGAGAVVTRDVAPGRTVIGVPAREVA